MKMEKICTWEQVCAADQGSLFIVSRNYYDIYQFCIGNVLILKSHGQEMSYSVGRRKMIFYNLTQNIDFIKTNFWDYNISFGFVLEKI